MITLTTLSSVSNLDVLFQKLAMASDSYNSAVFFLPVCNMWFGSTSIEVNIRIAACHPQEVDPNLFQA